jgi:hypothetical protein
MGRRGPCGSRFFLREGIIQIYSSARLHFMPAKPHKVGDKIQVSLSGGKIVDAIIKAVWANHTDGHLRYQVDFGHKQTVLIREDHIVKD